MSTSTIPLLNRSGFFPGALDTAAGLSHHDYVNLTSIDGDLGLREAYRIWWLLEQITITPSGTVAIGAASRSFSKQFRAPDSLDTGTASFNSVSGSITGNSISGAPVSPSEPSFRSGRSYLGILNAVAVNYQQSWTYGPNDSEEGYMSFVIQLVSGQWRLYYSFYGIITTRGALPPSVILVIGNPSIDIIPGTKTGTFSFLGYTLSWKSYTGGIAGESSSGEGVSCSTVEWTF